MTKLAMETKSGQKFYVMKEARRKSDPTGADVERALGRSRRYTPDALGSLQSVGALYEFLIGGRRFAFVRTDAPTILGGRTEGFWKVFQRRYGYKHAVHGNDRLREPELWSELVEYFCYNVEDGEVAQKVSKKEQQASGMPCIPRAVSPFLPAAATAMAPLPTLNSPALSPRPGSTEQRISAFRVNVPGPEFAASRTPPSFLMVPPPLAPMTPMELPRTPPPLVMVPPPMTSMTPMEPSSTSAPMPLLRIPMNLGTSSLPAEDFASPMQPQPIATPSPTSSVPQTATSSPAPAVN